MNLSPPTTAVARDFADFGGAWPSLANSCAIPFISEHAFWVAIIAYVVLAVGNLFRGL